MVQIRYFILFINCSFNPSKCLSFPVNIFYLSPTFSVPRMSPCLHFCWPFLASPRSLCFQASLTACLQLCSFKAHTAFSLKPHWQSLVSQQIPAVPISGGLFCFLFLLCSFMLTLDSLPCHLPGPLAGAACPCTAVLRGMRVALGSPCPLGGTLHLPTLDRTPGSVSKQEIQTPPLVAPCKHTPFGTTPLPPGLVPRGSAPRSSCGQ